MILIVSFRGVHFIFMSLSLAPGFSQVWTMAKRQTRFNGFTRAEKPLNRLNFSFFPQSPG
jgi:hypothetical protein